MVLEGILEPVLSVGLLILIAWVGFRVVKNVVVLIANSILGLVLLFSVQPVFGVSVVINLWSVLIAVLGGVLGAVLVIALHLTQIAF